MNTDQPIITIRNIGKKYDINRQKGGYIALRDILANILKSPFSFLKTKAKQITGFETKKEEFWALKNLNVDIYKGEIIGIIGANGAGKSTLLKILSRITPPTTGEIKINGRVGSLLEVGTGFHPELTGRENIFLNGAILGMTQKEVAIKFDEIVKFSGVEKFLDTPVKYYSSGMYVRLAFSVAAHMEPDILIVDEVLAVGDAEFQKKCLGKMDEVTKQDGRTILFVSHNLDAIERLCTKTILLKHGEIVKFGETSEVLSYYLDNERATNAITEPAHRASLDAQFTKVSILNKDKVPQAAISVGEKFFIEIDLDVRKPLPKRLITLHFYYHGELLLFATDAYMDGKYKDYAVGTYKTLVEIPAFLFQVGINFFHVSLKHLGEGRASIDQVKDVSFEITSDNNPKEPISGDNHWGKISTILKFDIKKTS